MKRFKVKVLDHDMDYSGKRSTVPIRESNSNVLFREKRDAWEYFYHLIGEDKLEERSFWIHFGWNDKVVETINMDEGGYTNALLYKWEGFDDDIEIGWEYNGVVYHSHKELDEAFPQYFKGKEMETDEPFLRGEEKQIAHLHIEIKNDDLKPKPKEEPKPQPPVVKESPEYDDDLPF